ncbi:MAG: glycosyltransferase family 2 protein [Gemmatimonadaceae bacterium]
MHSVSILIPCYQERNFIRACLESVIAFEAGEATLVEILVLDGMSTDGTRDVVEEMTHSDARVKLIDNPRRTQSAALNLGISLAGGDYIMRLDAHSLYPGDYLSKTVATAIRTGADNTGGVVETLQRGEGYQAAVVQAMTTHRFGVGDSGFRTDASEGPTDTVPYGCFRRDLFASIGLFDERLLRAQDYEMNRRIVASGGTVWMNPQIQVFYYQQPGLIPFIRKQIVHEAPYNAYMWYLAPYAFTPRHAVTGVFAAGVIAGLALWPVSHLARIAFAVVMSLYFLLAFGAGIQQAVRYRELRHALVLPGAFFLYHFLHGTGVLAGLARLAGGVAPVQGNREPWEGAGRLRALAPKGAT